MYRTLTAFASLAMLTLFAACGDFSDRKVCTANAAPGCVPDFGNFEVPNLNGPNPNYPDPNAFQPSMAADADLIGVIDQHATLTISEVMLSPAAGAGSQFIELHLNSNEPMALAGYALRSGDNVIDLGEYVVEAGGFFVVSLDSQDGDASGVALPANAGSLALFSPQGAMLDFVQWGAAGQALEADAVREGQWTPGEYCFTPDVGASLSHFANYGPGNTPANWWAQVPSAGAQNPPRLGVPNYSDR